MTNYITVEEEKLYRLLALEYLIEHKYNFDNLEEHIEDFIFEDGSNFSATYKKYGKEAFLYALGEYLAYINHLLIFEKTEPYDCKQFYFEKEKQETNKEYIERLINNARFDLSCKPLGKIELNKRDIWFTITALDDYNTVEKDIISCLEE